MYSKFREEVTNPLAQVNLIDDDYGIIFEFFWNLCFLFKEDLDNMLSLMLDLTPLV